MTNQMTVSYIDHMGNDLSPIRAAIVSNGATNLDKYVDDDLRYTKAAESLISFLARGCTSKDWDNLVDSAFHTCFEGEVEEVLNHVRHMPPHWTPFGHTAITLHIKAPMFVARQLGKHQVGFVWNEISRRYVDDEPEFYTTDVWRGRSADKKQGSEGVVTHMDIGCGYEGCCPPDGTMLHPLEDWVQGFNIQAFEDYTKLIESGVAPEQARMVLPQSTMTEWFWTSNLYGWSKMFVSRTDPHTQKETRDVAHMVGDMIKPLFPISWEALTNNS